MLNPYLGSPQDPGLKVDMMSVGDAQIVQVAY